jgi:hypothetical protein
MVFARDHGLHDVKNTNVCQQIEKRVPANTNVHRQMGLGLKFLVNYQLKQFGQSQRIEEIAV